MATTASEPLLLTVTWALSFEYCVWKPSIIELYTQWFSTPSGHSVRREQSGAAYVGGCVSLTRPVSIGYFCAFWSEVSSSFIPHLESAKNQNLNPDVMRATRHRRWPAHRNAQRDPGQAFGAYSRGTGSSGRRETSWTTWRWNRTVPGASRRTPARLLWVSATKSRRDLSGFRQGRSSEGPLSEAVRKILI